MPKRPKLTPAEKKELKARKKAEAKRLAILKKRQDQHDHLTREYNLGQYNIKRREKTWKQMLINIALPRMKDDLLFAWHNFERIVDVKDFTISLLMDALAEAEEQYMMNFKCHATHIDNLLIRFNDRLDEVKLKGSTELNSMRDCMEKETEDIQQNASDSEDYLKTMLFGLNVAKIEQEKLVRGNYLSKIDEESGKYADIIHTLRGNLEKRYSNTWDSTKAFLKEYVRNTAERRKLHDALKIQDQAVKKLCSEQLIKLQKMQEYSKKLKEQFNKLEEIQNQRINELRNENQYFVDILSTLKDRLEHDVALDNKNMKLLSMESNAARIYLEQIAKKAKKILELAAICRKYETQEEKILPFPSQAASKPNKRIKIYEYRNIMNLQIFWQRVAQADAVRHSINEEKEFLKRENKALKTKIHEYCNCIQCPVIDPYKLTTNKSGRINITDGYILQKNYDKHE